MKPLLLLIILFLAGCSNIGSPVSMMLSPSTRIDNNYYSVWPSSCAKFAYTSESKHKRPIIACYTEDGEFKGEIEGLTPEQYVAVQELAGVIVSAYRQSKYANYSTSSSYLGLKPVEVNFGSSLLSSKARQGAMVYSADQCIGPILAGVCRGTIINKKAPQARCHGTMIMGECKGALTSY